MSPRKHKVQRPGRAERPTRGTAGRPQSPADYSYLLKGGLKELWRYRSQSWAEKVWLSWKHRALRSGLERLRIFVGRLQPYLPGIQAHGRWPLGKNLVGGINNKIKIINCVAYGYRDDAYFFLNIREAFREMGEEPYILWS